MTPLISKGLELNLFRAPTDNDKRWTHQPDNWAQVAQPGVDQEMANFPDYIGHTNAECIAYRDQMLIDILKLHKKL